MGDIQSKRKIWTKEEFFPGIRSRCLIYLWVSKTQFIIFKSLCIIILALYLLKLLSVIKNKWNELSSVSGFLCACLEEVSWRSFGLNCLDDQTSSSCVCSLKRNPPERYLVNRREIDFADGGSETREGNLRKDKWKSGDRLNGERTGKLKNRTSCECVIGSGGRERAKDQEVNKTLKWQKAFMKL